MIAPDARRCAALRISMSSTKVTVKVDTKLCIAAASCVNVAPKFFDLDEDNVVFLIDPITGEVLPTWQEALDRGVFAQASRATLFFTLHPRRGRFANRPPCLTPRAADS